MPRIPLIDDLTIGQIPPGSNILVEFDPASQWYNASLTIAAGWLRGGGSVSYYVYTRPPANVRARLTSLGLDVQQLEEEEKLGIHDWYTATLGQVSREKNAVDSLKVADLSIAYAKIVIRREGEYAKVQSGFLIIEENFSVLDRFNEEKSWVEFYLTRRLPTAPLQKTICLRALAKGIHSDRVYKTLEAATDGVIDFKVEEVAGESRSFIGIRSMVNVGFDSRWYPLKLGENFEVALEK
jgi:KaiC/GvpD/RAD55 family RecA-like ATPase